MAQARTLRPQRRFNEDNIPHQSICEPDPCLQYTHQAFGSSHQLSSLDFQMAESILVCDALMQHCCELTSLKRGQYPCDSYMPSQSWALQQSPSQDNKPSVATCNIRSSNNMNYPPGQSWTSPTTFDWQRAMHQVDLVEPYIVPETDGQFRQNQELVYNPLAAQNTVIKGIGEYGGRASWVPSGLNGLPRGSSANGSDADTNNSMSPKSYISDDLENSYSPGPMSDYASSVVNWHGGYPRGSTNPAMPSSQFVPYPAQKVEDVPVAQVGPNMAMTVVPSTSFRRQGEAVATFEDAQQSGSEYSYSQGSSPGASPWFRPNYAHNLNGLPLRPHNAQGRNSHSANDTSLSSANDDHRMQYRQASWNGSRANIPTQSRMQDRFQVPKKRRAAYRRKEERPDLQDDQESDGR
jgi:hypothetical protein